MGCPIVSQLEVVSLGKTADGIEAFMDRAAYESDGVMLVGRVKWHTDFAGKIESGLFKMLAIGLGKFAGAQRYHAYAYRLGLEHVIRSIGRQVLQSGKILGGLAILEDANHNTAKLDAVPVEVMEAREEENLALVKSWMAQDPGGPRHPHHGRDRQEHQRRRHGHQSGQSGCQRPVQSLARYTADPAHFCARFERADIQQRGRPGNGRCSLGAAGEAHRLGAHLDQLADRQHARVHPHADSLPHRPRMRRAGGSHGGKLDLAEVTYGWIRNTMELGRLALSENLRSQIERNPALEIESTMDIEFDGDDNLISPFAPVVETAGVH